MPSVVSIDTKRRAKYTLYAKEPSKLVKKNDDSRIIDTSINALEFKENLRMRLLIDIGKLLGNFVII